MKIISFLKKHWLKLILSLLILLIIFKEAQGDGDFNIFLAAAEDLKKGGNIYEILYKSFFHYYYDTFFVMLLSLVSSFSWFVIKFAWLLLNVFFVYRIWKIICSWLPLENLSEKAHMWFSIFSFAFIISFLRDNFHLTQMSIFILFTTLEGVKLMEKDKKIGGAALLAMGISVKVMPLVFLPYLLYRKEWKGFAWTILFVAFYTFSPGVFIGFSYNMELLASRWDLINPLNAQHILDAEERSFHSLTTLLSTLLVENPGDQYALAIKRNIVDLPIETLGMIIQIVRLFFISLTLIALRSLPFRSSLSLPHKLYEIAFLCLLVPLIFPHQQHYAFFFVFPSTTYLLYVAFTSQYDALWKKYAFRSLLFFLFFVLNARFILGTFIEYYDHFKTLTYGTIILLVTHLYFRKKTDGFSVDSKAG